MIKDRIYTRATIERMTAEFEGKTNFQAQESISRYVGRWLFVDDTLDDVMSPTGDSISVWVRDDDPYIVMSFNIEWQASLAVLEKGTRIVAAGQISEIGGYRIRLENCELYYYE